jgi:hypothetical protein
MKIIPIIGLLVLVAIKVPAQENFSGNILVYQDPLIDTLLRDYQDLRLKILENPENKAIPGYRIQIFFDSGLNSSDRAKLARDQFLVIYPEIQAYVSWKAPNYRVRVGDYKTRLEAEKSLQLILIDYPNAWVTKDEINFPLTN